MLYAPAKVPLLSRECFERNVAVVVVGFPATTLTTARARICISASHTDEDLDYGLEVRSILPFPWIMCDAGAERDGRCGPYALPSQSTVNFSRVRARHP